MKAFKYLSTALVLAVATTVTAGSMYITVRAAAQQQDPLIAEAATAIQDAAVTDPLVRTADEIPVVPAVQPSLPPDQILSDRSNDIVLDAEGGFAGRLSSIAAADGGHHAASQYTVKVLQRGGVIGNTMTDSEGRFGFTGLEPGVSGILAFSETGLMLYGVRLVAPDGATDIAGIREEVVLATDSTVVASQDVQLAREMIMNALSNGEHRFSGVVSAEDHEFKFGSGEPSTSLVSHRVQLEGDGSLRGEISILDPRTGRNREVFDMTVHFLRDGQLIASAKAERNGSFVAAGLNPGIYSFVGTGNDGVFAIGVEIMGSAYEAAENGNPKDGEFTPASVVRSLELSIAAVGAGIINQDNIRIVTVPETPVAPFGAGPMGGFGGGGSFGGGGGGVGGGGGGLGTLLAGAAGALGGYLAGNDDDDDDPPASPGI